MDENKDIQYDICFEKNSERFTHKISLNLATQVNFVRITDPPDWCKLSYKKCPNCPLDEQFNEHCPLALRLIPFVELTSCVSFDRVNCKVSIDDKTIEKHTTAQEAFSSLLGLVMATSGCPHTSFFKPMAWFHQPFSSENETIMRACSSFLLSKHFDNDRSLEGDSLFTELKSIYEEMHTINIQIAKRIQRDSSSDSTMNAIVLLDIFTSDFAHALEDDLNILKRIFRHKLQ